MPGEVANRLEMLPSLRAFDRPARVAPAAGVPRARSGLASERAPRWRPASTQGCSSSMRHGCRARASRGRRRRPRRCVRLGSCGRDDCHARVGAPTDAKATPWAAPHLLERLADFRIRPPSKAARPQWKTRDRRRLALVPAAVANGAAMRESSVERSLAQERSWPSPARIAVDLGVRLPAHRLADPRRRARWRECWRGAAIRLQPSLGARRPVRGLPAAVGHAPGGVRPAHRAAHRSDARATTSCCPGEQAGARRAAVAASAITARARRAWGWDLTCGWAAA